MNNVQFQTVQSNNHNEIALIAAWYLEEWGITHEATQKKIAELARDKNEFHVLMSIEGKPVATGGIYTSVSLVDKEPRFRALQPWLALVYTVPELRGNGFGAVLCEYITQHAQMLGLKELHLFTDTAERLYRRLGWQELERLQVGTRNIVVMQKNLW